MTQKEKEEVIALIREFSEKNYRSGKPRVAPHRHDKVDNLPIKFSDLIGVPTFAGGLNGFQVFTSSSTFTVPSGFTKFWVRGVGAGAGGGSTVTSATAANSGGAGAYCEKFVNLSGISTVTVTIGAAGTGHSSTSAGNGTDGGDTTFGSYFTAGGGKGSGVGGTATNGDLNINGGNQGLAFILYGAGATTSALYQSATSGVSMFGHGTNGAQGGIGSQADGNNASFYGDGGSGGAIGTAGAGPAKGGDGFGGLAIVMW